MLDIAANGPEISPSPSNIRRVCLTDCLFEVRQDIRSLPQFHGARWSAWIRFACKAAGMQAEDVILSLFPLRAGQMPLEKGQMVFLRLFVNPPALHLLPKLTASMNSLPARGEFCSRNLKFLGYLDTVRRKNLVLKSLREGSIEPVSRNDFAPETALCARCTRLHLDFLSPLRLVLPAGQKSLKMADKERYCGPEWFLTADEALTHLLRRVRFMGDAACGQNLKIVSASLRWVDMHYNARRCMALGGTLGTLCLEGEVDDEAAARLVLGQYLGAGKNGRFGLGFWRIRELVGVRTLPLPEPLA